MPRNHRVSIRLVRQLLMLQSTNPTSTGHDNQYIRCMATHSAFSEFKQRERIYPLIVFFFQFCKILIDGQRFLWASGDEVGYAVCPRHRVVWKVMVDQVARSNHSTSWIHFTQRLKCSNHWSVKIQARVRGGRRKIFSVRTSIKSCCDFGISV